VVIIADDLTGACDAAAPFAARGAEGTVSLWSRPLACSEICSISTESRDVEEAEIRRRMQCVAGARRQEIVFKKIDSTLRGHVRAEIEVAMEAFGLDSAVVTPAFPDMGRIVRDGCLHVHGKPYVHSGPNLLDAVCNQDLDDIVAANLDKRVLWAGSGGLAWALARKLYGEPRVLEPPRVEAPLVFCIGSDHPATVEQVRALRTQRVFPIVRGQTSTDEIQRTVRGAGALFITGGDTASLVLAAIGAQGIAVRHEVLTGVPWGVLVGGELDGLPVVTKSGGFGAPDTLLRVAEFFKR
jgi:uncharacterized protein YgbK (DUF1537 family)